MSVDIQKFVDALPNVPMKMIAWHWTAGTHTPNDTDKRAYHILVTGEGDPVLGTPSISLNSGSLKPGYAAHTLNCNTDSIGISLCGMGGATEVPFSPGKWPIQPKQISTLAELSRLLGIKYGIPVTRKRMLSHAEVQPTLGIKQRAKWDWSILPGPVSSLRGAVNIGDWIRNQIASAPVKEVQVIPDGASIRAKLGMNAFSGPGSDHSPKGHVPADTVLIVTDQSNGWLRVTTPGGYDVWVPALHADLIDGPQPLMPTTPDPTRDFIKFLRDKLDEWEASL